MDGLQTLSLVLLAAAAAVGVVALAVAARWIRGSAARQARPVPRRSSRPAAAPEPPVPQARAESRPVRPATPAPAAAPAPGVMRTQLVDLPLFDDEPTAPMMHIDLAPASGWPDTMPPALATMARQYAETQPAEMQKAG